ncbi:glucosaminidase domain-containing protein [Croceimicrobium sp.]|uniref:glucosaminidase domain-containing protein n=1 Tax=Croceimicrobium sp. TaxID=2828340 RepID=UPI003BAB1569
MDKETFVRTYLPLAQKAGERFGMNPSVILAQAAIESGWGSSYGARVRKNFFGITAAGSPNEFWDGSYTVANNQYRLKFRVYKTAQDSFYDFARLISSRYKTAHSVSNDSTAYARAIAYSPYISESNGDNREVYRKGIISTFNSISSIIKKKDLSLSDLQEGKPSGHCSSQD